MPLIPVDILPSRVYLSQEDQVQLFGVGHPMTIFASHSQPGQFVYEEMLQVFGSFKRSLPLRVMGPNWKQSHVCVTATEAAFLGFKIETESKMGDVSMAAPCRLVGPNGELTLPHAAIVPMPHILCAPDEAASLHVQNGDLVTVELIGDKPQQIERVLIRVHPTYRLRMEIHQDYGRDFWIVRPAHARIV